MTAIGDRVALAYDQAAWIIHRPTPYLFGGGHPGIGGPKLDCSGFASWVLQAGGILSIPHAKVALDTEEFESWGIAGPGKLLTVWVRDSGGVDHMFLEFHGKPHRYCEAPHTGENCMWFSSADTTGYNPRHWPNS
jgi:hypothetical protein